MKVYVIGFAVHPPRARETSLRLEEIVYRTSREALDSAGVSRRQLDAVTLGACDELDGRPISSMLMAAPAGGYLTDELKVTDSGASAFCLAVARCLGGESKLGLVASWCKSSKADVEQVMRFRAEPFFTRPLGLDRIICDALFAQAVSTVMGVTEAEVARRVAQAYSRAARNPRGMLHPVPTPAEVGESPYLSTPLRAAQCAPLTDGAVSMVIASEAFLRENRAIKPIARVAGVGWATDSYRLDHDRLGSLRSARIAWQNALEQAAVDESAMGAVELDTQTGYHEAAYVRAFGLRDDEAVSPAGGPFAQNPFFCSGLVHATEAVRQVAGKAGPVQRPGTRWAAAHACHGYAQQGNVVMVFEAAGERQ